MRTEIDKILSEYEEKKTLYLKFGVYIEDLLTELLSLNNLKIHTVNHRIKASNSLKKKILDHPEKKYHTLDMVTDLVGLRVITYFTDTVDKVKALIDEEFEVDEINSIDKRTVNNTAEFGYSSLNTFNLSVMTTNGSEYHFLFL